MRVTLDDVQLGSGAHVRCHGKGRKDRATPLTRQTMAVLRAWLAELGPAPDRPLFPTRSGRQLSRDAVERLVHKHAAAGARHCPTMQEKTVTPHTLRHSCAMALLHGGVDTSVIALWLGHEDADTTQIYLHADTTIKEQALARVRPPGASPGRYRPPTPCSHSWTTSDHHHRPPDYAEPRTANLLPTNHFPALLGIIRASA